MLVRLRLALMKGPPVQGVTLPSASWEKLQQTLGTGGQQVTMDEDGWMISACVFAGKLWRRRTVVQAPQGDGRPCASQMEQWKPCLVKPCYSWRYSAWSECKSEVWHSVSLLIEID